MQRKMVFPEDYRRHKLLVNLYRDIYFTGKLPNWFKEACKMHELLLEEKVNNWIGSRLGNGSSLQVKFEGELYDWIDPSIYVSNISSLNYCTYQHGLTAKIFKETGILPVPTEESEILMEGGRKGHEALGDALDIPPDVDFTKEEVKRDPREALKKLLTSEDAHTIEFPIAQPFKDIYIRGRIDHINFSYGAPKLIEEWKFTQNGRVKPDHLLQAKIYSYLMYRWLGSLNFEYVIKAWLWNSWSKEEQLDAFEFGMESPEPSDMVTEKFTNSSIREVEYILSRANNFFTGKEECQALPGVGCGWCPVGEKYCKHYQKPIWIDGQVNKVDYEKQEVLINFKVS